MRAVNGKREYGSKFDGLGPGSIDQQDAPPLEISSAPMIQPGFRSLFSTSSGSAAYFPPSWVFSKGTLGSHSWLRGLARHIDDREARDVCGPIIHPMKRNIVRMSVACSSGICLSIIDIHG